MTVCNMYIFGYEICPISGQKHPRPFMILKKRMRITELNLTMRFVCETVTDQFQCIHKHR